MLPLLPALLGLCSLFSQTAAPVDPAKDIGSNDPARRLAAVKALAQGGKAGTENKETTENTEKLLIKALKDDDWEVASIASSALGELGAKKALEPLIDVALEGPVRGLRRAASEALGRIDAAGAYEKLQKKLGDDQSARACEAIAAFGPALERPPKTKALEKLLEEREAVPRRMAARALVASAGETRAARLKEFLGDRDVALRAAVIEAAGASHDAKTLEPLVALYESSGLPDFLARRVHESVRELFLAHPDQRGAFNASLARVAATPAARGHVARLVGLLAQERQGTRALEPGQALEALDPFVADGDPKVRATAAAALGRIGTDEALDKVAKLAADDRDARARRIALGIVARARGGKHAGTRAILLARLSSDDDARVREVAAVALGVRNVPEVVPVLEASLNDPDWTVVTAAAVSLGKTENEGSAAALVALYQRGVNDWRTRATAIAGLTCLKARVGVPTLIAALEDGEALVARTAYEFLAAVAHQRLEPKVAVWTKWWEENEKKIRLSIPEEVLERRKKLEYARNSPSMEAFLSGTYLGIDVLVLQSRGDHIENELADMKIEHRRTNSGQVLSDGLHPQGVFVANCTGEITQDEAQRLAWFVRAGGALFGSCWALHETIEGLQPGMMQKLETRGEVLGEVPAYPCDPTSQYLEGIFPPDVRPIYHLEGAHLIEVLDPEEVEVLIDSPQCAAAFGGGDLAAWYRLGHGVVLDSVNHFEGQGFRSASNVSEPEARMAYAVDHLGLSYERLRELRKEKFWSKSSAAAENVKDLSVLRLITNFVWLKRQAEE